MWVVLLYDVVGPPMTPSTTAGKQLRFLRKRGDRRTWMCTCVCLEQQLSCMRSLVHRHEGLASGERTLPLGTCPLPRPLTRWSCTQHFPLPPHVGSDVLSSSRVVTVQTHTWSRPVRAWEERCSGHRHLPVAAWQVLGGAWRMSYTTYHHNRKDRNFHGTDPGTTCRLLEDFSQFPSRTFSRCLFSISLTGRTPHFL